jgi:hypothetical protein|tara:strand:- start:159 stop:317 length:159 start_codon:yes stop_codon:yes gene_type:complete
MNKKMKGYIQYFENLDYYKKQKRKEFLTNVLEFIGTLFFFFLFYIALILINI